MTVGGRDDDGDAASAADDDGWTTVRVKKGKRGTAGLSSFRRRRRGGGKNGATDRLVAGAREPALALRGAVRPGDVVDRGGGGEEGGILFSADDAKGGEDEKRGSLVVGAVLRAMEALRESEFVRDLLRILSDVRRRSGDSGGGRGAEVDRSRSSWEGPAGNAAPMFRDIVCYGIGNFATGEGLGGGALPAPLLQLAGALLLRRAMAEAAASESAPGDWRADGDRLGTATYPSGSSSPPPSSDPASPPPLPPQSCRFAEEQRAVRLLYYDPIATSLEHRILTESLCIDVLPENERGKRRVQPDRMPTLFYMPHCPMRLYSNVLWANWDEDGLTDGNVVFFGNSFRSYDDRTIDGTRRGDDTNCVLRVLPFAEERAVDWSGKRRGGRRRQGGVDGDRDGALSNLEIAFNDCAVVSFASRGDDGGGSPWPPKPREHFAAGERSPVAGEDVSNSDGRCIGDDEIL